MRVALHVDGTAIRGNEVQAIVIARELKKRGHHVGVSCIAGGVVEAELRRLGIETTGARPRGDAEIVGALRFAAWLRRGRYDALLLTSWKRSFATGWAGRVARVPRIVYRVGGVHRIPGGPSGWKHRRTLLRYVDCVVANSGVVVDHLRRSVPDLPAERIRLVLNGAAIPPAPPADLRRELALRQGDVLAVAVGGLERRKGYDVILEALAALGDPSLLLAIAGDGAEAHALEERALQLGVDLHVFFLGQCDDVPAVLAAADLFVLASRSEGFSVALLEAMAARVPAISSDVGGAREALGPREGRPAAGWIVPREDPRALSDALREVAAGVRVGSPEVMARAEEGAWRMENWFTVDAMMDGIEAALRGDPAG
jgi:glycosyltransferase involved in cell wall biosynthesis